jgi:hypothetical protein
MVSSKSCTAPQLTQSRWDPTLCPTAESLIILQLLYWLQYNRTDPHLRLHLCGRPGKVHMDRIMVRKAASICQHKYITQVGKCLGRQCDIVSGPVSSPDCQFSVPSISRRTHRILSTVSHSSLAGGTVHGFCVAPGSGYCPPLTNSTQES